MNDISYIMDHDDEIEHDYLIIASSQGGEVIAVEYIHHKKMNFIEDMAESLKIEDSRIVNVDYVYRHSISEDYIKDTIRHVERLCNKGRLEGKNFLVHIKEDGAMLFRRK